MAQTFNGAFCVVTTVGFTAATGAASARSVIPIDSSGNRPSYIRVAGINQCHVKLGDVTVAATANDLMVNASEAVILHVPKWVTNIAYIQGTAAGTVNVVPLDNS